ncbi:MAG TPA: tetraacyldisaccharide 4'-kinase, partial [Rhodobacterales bacterium]|nr:tetraacyldisaccharide 4'-kinase [Rhodobacterales bacterium]
AQRLAQRGRQVHVVTRGTGTPHRIDERRDDPAIVGDDPLLIAAFAPTWIAHDLADGVTTAAAAGAEIVVLDGDPAQGHISAAATIFVEDALRGFGNGLAWPLGPLAQPIGRGLGMADLLIAVGPPRAQTTFQSSWGAAIGCPIAPAQLTPLETGMEWEGLDVVAFAGIGAPERFFASLKSLGANLVRAQALSDHQELTPALLARLEKEANASHAQLVTTEKDAVRLPRAFRQKVVSLPVRLELADWTPLDALLD